MPKFRKIADMDKDQRLGEELLLQQKVATIDRNIVTLRNRRRAFAKRMNQLRASTSVRKKAK